MIIAIDGGAGTGKSSTSKLIAQKLKLDYLDTGAMYRAYTLYKLNEMEGSFEDNFKFSLNPEKQVFTLDNNDVTTKIRDEEVTKNVTRFASNQSIRKELISLQQKIVLNSNNIILEGRDTTSVVCPNADLKIILKTDVKAREERRRKDGEFVGDLKNRDKKDLAVNDFETSKDDTITIDNTFLSLNETVNKIINLIK